MPEITLPKLTGADTIRYDFSIDGGTKFLTYSDQSWVANTSGFSAALNQSALTPAVFSKLPNSESLVVRAYLKSGDGTTSPILTAVRVGHE